MVTDGAGRVMTDTSGASQLTYKPYGEVNRMNSYGPDIFRYKYTGQQDDQDTGLYFYKARYYDPVLGVFTSADTVTNATSSFGLNHYMYVEGNPLRYGDESGNVWGALLYSAMQFAMGTAAAIAIGTAAVAVGATIAVGLAVANSAMAAAAIAQTAAIATATFVANSVVAAVRFSLFVNALGTIGTGIGFVAGGLDTGTLQGALAGAEIGFKIGTAIQIAVDIAVGGYYLSGIAAVKGTTGALAEKWASSILTKILTQGIITANAFYLVSIGKFLLEVAIISVYGQIVNAVGREAGGHLNPDIEGFRYDRDSARRGEAAAGFINSSSQILRGITDASNAVYDPEALAGFRTWNNASHIGWDRSWLIGITPFEIGKVLIPIEVKRLMKH